VEGSSLGPGHEMVPGGSLDGSDSRSFWPPASRSIHPSRAERLRDEPHSQEDTAEPFAIGDSSSDEIV
jgi:hypothetical protein